MNNLILVIVLGVLGLVAWRNWQATTIGVTPGEEATPPGVGGGGGGGTTIEGYIGGDNAPGAGVGALPDGTVTTVSPGTTVATTPTGTIFAPQKFEITAEQVNQAIRGACSGATGLAYGLAAGYDQGRYIMPDSWAVALKQAAAGGCPALVGGAAPSTTTRQTPGTPGELTQVGTGGGAAVIVSPSAGRVLPQGEVTGSTSIATRGIAAQL